MGLTQEQLENIDSAVEKLQDKRGWREIAIALFHDAFYEYESWKDAKQAREGLEHLGFQVEGMYENKR